jgi:hypothetical protein
MIESTPAKQRLLYCTIIRTAKSNYNNSSHTEWTSYSYAYQITNNYGTLVNISSSFLEDAEKTYKEVAPYGSYYDQYRNPDKINITNFEDIIKHKTYTYRDNICYFCSYKGLSTTSVSNSNPYGADICSKQCNSCHEYFVISICGGEPEGEVIGIFKNNKFQKFPKYSLSEIR